MGPCIHDWLQISRKEYTISEMTIAFAGDGGSPMPRGLAALETSRVTPKCARRRSSSSRCDDFSVSVAESIRCRKVVSGSEMSG